MIDGTQFLTTRIKKKERLISANDREILPKYNYYKYVSVGWRVRWKWLTEITNSPDIFEGYSNNVKLQF